MNKEFIPYEQALELKELGFDEKCIYYFRKNNKNEFILFQNDLGECYVNADFDKVLVWDEYLENPQCSAPLYQQAFRWFREKYNLYSTINVDMTMEPKFCYSIYEYDLEKYSEGWWIAVVNSDLYYTHEEAELACLNKLIEIVKNK